MKKKNYAAVAVALVTGGLAARGAKAGLYSPTPVQNGGFEFDIVNNPSYYNQDVELTGWYRVSGHEGWVGQSVQSIANDSASSSAYAVLSGNGSVGGQIFQPIGTFNPNSTITINYLEAYAAGATGQTVTVSLYSGGTAVNTGTNSYGANYGTYQLSNATFLGSQSIMDSGSNSFASEVANISTGTLGTAGSTLWLDISTSSTSSSDVIAIDDVSATGPVVSNPLLTWTGSSNLSSGWNTTATNFNNASHVATAFSNGSDVLFDDTAGAGKTTVNVTANVSPSDITFNNSTYTYTLSGSGSITGGTTLTKNGTASVIITNTNTFTGPVAINAGVIILQSGGGLGTAKSVTVASGATLAFQSSSGFVASIPASISGTGAGGQPGALVNISGNNTLYGNLNLATDSTVSVTAGNLTLNSAVNGAGALTKTGSGTLTLATYNYYTGDTNVNAGTLVLTSGGYGGSIISNNLNINAGATVSATPSGGDALGYGGPGYQVNNINIVGGTFNDGANSNEGYDTAWNLTGGSITSTGGGAINFDAASGFGITTFNSSTTSVISAPLEIRTGTLTFTVAKGTTASGIDLSVSGKIFEAGGSGIDKEGPGTLALIGSNTYTGQTTVNGGTLLLGDGTAGHDGLLNTAGIQVNNSSSLVFDTNASQSFGGSIGGDGSGIVTKTGPGVLTLSGSVFAASVNVSSGKLYTTASINVTSLTVASGATLGGTGSLSPVTVASGGILEAGDGGVGQLTMSGLTFNGSGAINIFGLANYASSTALQVNGTLSTASAHSVTINISNLAGASTGTAYQLIGYSSETGPNVSSYTLALPRGDAGTLSDTGSQIDLTLSSVGGSYYLLWTGAANASKGWDTVTANWSYNGSPTTYIDSPGDPVLFDDTPGSNQTVAIKSGDVHPASVTFNNSNYSYTVTGPNAIAGGAGLTLNGTGTVILENSNTYTGATTINAGTLQLGSGVSGQDGTISTVGGVSIASGGTLAFDESTAKTYAGVISGAGNVTVSGPGAITLTAPQNTDTGTLTLNAGATVTLAAVVSVTPAYETQDFTNIIVGSGATLDISTVHTFGYAGGTRGAITINGGTVFNLGNDNYLGAVTMTAGNIGGTGELRLQNNLGATTSTLTTLPSATTATINVTNFALVPYSSYPVIFNVSQGTTASGIDLLISSNIDNAGVLDKIGAGTMEISGNDTYSGGTSVGGGTLILASAGAIPASTPLAITTGGLVVAATHGSGAKNDIVALGLSFSGSTDAWTGKLDLKNNDLIVRGGNFSVTVGSNTYNGTASLADITDQVKEGYNAGGATWQGSGGITSSTAAADTTHLHALGVIANDDGTNTNTALYSTFDGASTVEGDVLVKYTYYGDANLDGKVDGSDYSRIDNGHLMGLTGWFNGDFNYDGVINGSDYTLIDNAYNTQGAQISAQVAAATAEIAGATGAVPEPASLALLGFGAVGLLGRRRRR